MLETTPDGTMIRYSTGINVMAKRENVAAVIEGPGGRKITYMVEKEEAEEVAKVAIGAWLTKGLANIAGRSADLTTKTDGAIALKGTKDPNIIPVDPNVIPKDPNVIPLDPN